jgi:hypothetical protein
MAYTRIDLSHTESDLSKVGFFGSLAADRPRDGFHALGRFFKAIAGGLTKAASCLVKRGAVKASGTITLSSHVATDTSTIAGVVFTCVASGATGDQYNVGGSDEATAENLADAVNASTSAGIANCVTASAASGVVTIEADVPAALGNSVTLAISAHGSVSGARLASGSDGSSTSLSLL